MRRTRITQPELDKIVKELDVRGAMYWLNDDMIAKMMAKKYRLSKSLASHILFTMVTTEPKKL